MNRKVEVLVGGIWDECDMQDLNVDDIFRMFEPNGDPVSLGGMWIVYGEPYLASNGIWGVSCEPIIGVYSTE